MTILFELAVFILCVETCFNEISFARPAPFFLPLCDTIVLCEMCGQADRGISQ